MELDAGSTPPPAGTGVSKDLLEADRQDRARRRKAWSRLLVTLIAVLVVLLVLTVAPLGSATRTKSSSWTFMVPLGEGGGTDSVSANLPQLCAQSRSYHNLTDDLTLTLLWSTATGNPVSSLELVSTGSFPWTVFYNVSNEPSGTSVWNSSSELAVACSSSLLLIVGETEALTVHVEFTLSCKYSVAAPLL